MDYKNYLKRIGFTGEAVPDYETLYELQYRHFLTVPYENLDILNDIPLSLETADLYDKIVVRKRGGYCFELNALFNWLLCEIGYKTTTYFARFLLDLNEIPMRRHRIMRVEIGGAYYIADVGVGSVTPERPLRLIENEETEIRTITYKFTKDPFLGWVLNFKKIKDENWRPLYSFTEEAQLEVDFVQPNFYCQKHEDSIFNKTNMFAIRTETGKYTLDGSVFKTADLSGNITSAKECDENEITEVLKNYFGVEN